VRGRRQHLLLRALARPAAHRRAGHLPARGAPTRRRRRQRRRLGRRRRRRRRGQARAALVLGSRRAAVAQGRLLVLRAVPCTHHGAAAPGCRSMWPCRLGMSWQPALPCSSTVTASSKRGRCGAAARRGSGTAAGCPRTLWLPALHRAAARPPGPRAQGRAQGGQGPAALGAGGQHAVGPPGAGRAAAAPQGRGEGRGRCIVRPPLGARRRLPQVSSA